LAPTQDEVIEVRAKLIMALVVEALHGGFLDRAVHPLDPAVGPGVFHLGQPALYAVFAANAPANVLEGAGTRHRLKAPCGLIRYRRAVQIGGDGEDE